MPPSQPILFLHPLSSYCQKVLIALYENGTPFDYRNISDETHMRELARRWPMKRFPTLVDGERTVIEASTIVEYLQVHYPGPVRLLPDDPALALEVRMLDRFFDNYISTPQQKCVADLLRAEDRRDPQGVDEARRTLEIAYAWLDEQLEGRTWVAGDVFSLADCGAAPFLFYAQRTHAIPEAHANVHAYRRRLLERPSFARAVDEARPYRKLFPPGEIVDE